ncbi:MAG TPA: OB-fold nucleic acid binding domain-containing protein, partial [Burkholderiales bacterium]|nr:OB-fold nucleic acid binding domain-containing protein [Burkholderiales bacterium]
LNSQPMGFYAPSQLVQDVKRHGVEVRPVDVCCSNWDCTLEQGENGKPAIRLGLRMIKGLQLSAAEKLVAIRAGEPFDSVADLARRVKLKRHDLECLAAGGALASLAGHRHLAHWKVAGEEAFPALLANASIHETAPCLAAPTEGEDLVADYENLGLTLGRHPLALLRRKLRKLRVMTAAELRELPHGKITRTAGLVIGRQHPDTVSGVTFVTLEDETGHINIIVWRNLAEKQRRELLTSRLLTVHGVLEREGDIIHLIAGKLIDNTAMLGRLKTASRDFH